MTQPQSSPPEKRKFQPLTDMAKEAVSPSKKSINERRAVLQREITGYVRRGFRVVSQTDTTAQLVKPKHFSLLWFLIWALLLIGWIFYLAWYLMKRDEQVYLDVDEFGRVHRRK